jgi:hypothetical protein
MGTRIVTDHLEHADGKPWANAVVWYRLTGSYTLTTTYPIDNLRAETDENGDYEIELWTNAEGLKPSKHIRRTPDGKEVAVVVPAGDTPISFSLLQAASEPVPPAQQPSLIELIDTQLDLHNADPNAHRQIRQVLSIDNNGVTSFTLDEAPSLPHLSELFLNGIKARYGDHYTINATQLNWIDPMQLEPTDYLEVLFR